MLATCTEKYMATSATTSRVILRPRSGRRTRPFIARATTRIHLNKRREQSQPIPSPRAPCVPRVRATLVPDDAILVSTEQLLCLTKQLLCNFTTTVCNNKWYSIKLPTNVGHRASPSTSKTMNVLLEVWSGPHEVRRGCNFSAAPTTTADNFTIYIDNFITTVCKNYVILGNKFVLLCKYR
jgi:hypothetical protein